MAGRSFWACAQAMNFRRPRPLEVHLSRRVGERPATIAMEEQLPVPTGRLMGTCECSVATFESPSCPSWEGSGVGSQKGVVRVVVQTGLCAALAEPWISEIARAHR